MTEKWCEGCKMFHPVKDFNKRTDSNDGLATYCRTYYNKYQNKLLKKKREFLKEMKMFAPV